MHEEEEELAVGQVPPLEVVVANLLFLGSLDWLVTWAGAPHEVPEQGKVGAPVTRRVHGPGDA